MPQGTLLALLLFLMYINDLQICVRNKVRLYTDDILHHNIAHQGSYINYVSGSVN